MAAVNQSVFAILSMSLFIATANLPCFSSAVASAFQLRTDSRRRTSNVLKPGIGSTVACGVLSSTAIGVRGKLWEKLHIPADDPGTYAWYVMNCVSGQEMVLLEQCQHVAADLLPNNDDDDDDEGSAALIEKFVVPTKRKIRSHGKYNVVDLSPLYPGYVFCKMTLCAETYELLQSLPLCRSWMGTVNVRGYKKSPPIPLPLGEDEVRHFSGLEAETDKIYRQFGEDYTGKGDLGLDLLNVYRGYEVGNMVKILRGNFKGEDGIVRRLKNEQVLIRMYTYGSTFEEWMDFDDIRVMTDEEASKGLTGPDSPLRLEDIQPNNIHKQQRDSKQGDLRKSLWSQVSGTRQRDRKEDRQSRGESRRRAVDALGRTSEEAAKEEENWTKFRQEQPQETLQPDRRVDDLWGMKERSSWNGGEVATPSDIDSQWGRRPLPKDTTNRTPKKNERNSDEDDFFNSLMSELSDTLERGGTQTTTKDSNQALSKSRRNDNSVWKDDELFTSLMSELSDSSNTVERSTASTISNESKMSQSTMPPTNDFFASLEAALNDSIPATSTNGRKKKLSKDDKEVSINKRDMSDDDFFSSLEADLNGSAPSVDGTNNNHINSKAKDSSVIESNDDFFASLEKELASGSSSTTRRKNSSYQQQQQNKPERSSSLDGIRSSATTLKSNQELNNLTIPALKIMLKERGLKVSGRKSELIDRLLRG